MSPKIRKSGGKYVSREEKLGTNHSIVGIFGSYQPFEQSRDLFNQPAGTHSSRSLRISRAVIWSTKTRHRKFAMSVEYDVFRTRKESLTGYHLYPSRLVRDRRDPGNLSLDVTLPSLWSPSRPQSHHSIHMSFAVGNAESYHHLIPRPFCWYVSATLSRLKRNKFRVIVTKGLEHCLLCYCQSYLLAA